jgi:hypothetical protein
MLVGLVVVAAGVAVASFAVRPSKARAFDLFYGTAFINDNTSPVAVDLATGRPTVRLQNAYTQVSARQSGDLDVTPLRGGTLLLDTATGEFNMVDATGFVIKTKGGGVQLPKQNGASVATAVSTGDSAYIVQTSGQATAVYLVSQSTVASAIGSGTRTKARAYANLGEPPAAPAGATASAGGNLWILLGAGRNHTIRELSLPTGSDVGVALDSHDHGSVSGVAAIASATVRGDGTGGEAVAVAGSDELRIFGADGSTRSAKVTGGSGVDAILPASNQQGRFTFLYHTASGWSLVSSDVARGDATTTALRGIDASERLAAPAQSNGRLFTMGTDSRGNLWQIAANGTVQPIRDAPAYPILAGEGRDLSGAAVSAFGSRVIFNSRANLEALAVFSDDSHVPVVIDKRTAVDVNANGAAAIADEHQKSPSDTPSKEPKPQPGQEVNDKIDCKTTSQTPHVPAVELLSRGSRSVQLQWSYPLLAPTDCTPSTYSVSVQADSADAPKPPASVTVQGQNGVNLVGLFPDTAYRITVTAFINGTGTASEPLGVRTSVEGPAAPTNVKAGVDSAGNWTLSWDSCGGLKDSCVPSASWTVIPAFCDNLPGLASPPASGSVVGDPTLHSFTYTYPGSDDLLGRGLTFQVEGTGEKGTIGTPAGTAGCAYSWSPPIAGAMSVVASTPPGQTQVGDTTTATVDLRLGANPVRAAGGVGATFTYQLALDGKVVASFGPTNALEVSFTGVKPGQSYQAQVVVAPPQHPSAAVTVGPVTVPAASSAWPAVAVAPRFITTSTSTGSLQLAFSGVSSASANGETFDLLNTPKVNSALTCGNTATLLTASGFDPGTPLLFTVDRSQYYGDCTVTIFLQEHGAGTLLYGGRTSPMMSAQVTIPPPSVATSANDFSATWDGSTPNTVNVSYTGGNPLVTGPIARSWRMVLSYAVNGTRTECASVDGGPSAAITAPSGCLGGIPPGAKPVWSVAVSFSFPWAAQGPYPVTVAGAAPSPVVSAGDFAASWAAARNGTNQAQVNLTYSGTRYSAAQLGAFGWNEMVTVSAGPSSCGQTTWTPDAANPTSIGVLPDCTPPAPGNAGLTYAVTITSTNSAQPPVTITVAGTPPP